jgi:glucan phosphoethanolaminetransferase (alkaline phosphatase superfamily)
LRLYINPTYHLYAIGQTINSQFKTQRMPFKVIGEDARIDRDSQHKKLVIMIAGETARADRFSLNGYQRLTNPLLTKESVLSFSQMLIPSIITYNNSLKLNKSMDSVQLVPIVLAIIFSSKIVP